MVGGLVEGAGATGAGVLALVLARFALRARRRARLIGVARAVTTRHARLLSVKQRQLVAHDGYGNYELRPWIDHVDYFLAHVVLREARALGRDMPEARPGTPLWGDLRRALLATLHADEGAARAPVEDADIISGEHYEVLCRNLLQARGWSVETTPVTGDQGADLIADGAGRRVVIQCKFYAKPVGNKAVQEAHAALGFHAGDRAAVVSNASFTRSARALAAANGVLLLHHRQLGDLGDLLGGA